MAERVILCPFYFPIHSNRTHCSANGQRTLFTHFAWALLPGYLDSSQKGISLLLHSRGKSNMDYSSADKKKRRETMIWIEKSINVPCDKKFYSRQRKPER